MPPVSASFSDTIEQAVQLMSSVRGVSPESPKHHFTKKEDVDILTK